MSLWQIVVEETNGNIINNSGFENSTYIISNDWKTLFTETLTQVTTEKFNGLASLEVFCDSVVELVQGTSFEFSSLAGATYNASVYIKGEVGKSYALYFSNQGSHTVLAGTATETIVADGTWQLIENSYVEGVASTRWMNVLKVDDAATGTFYLDEVYLDGEFVYDLRSDLGFYDESTTGAGLAAVTNVNIGHGIRPGSTYQRSLVGNRLIQFKGNFVADDDDRVDYHSKRSAFLRLVAPDRGDYLEGGEDKPIVLQYTGGSTPLRTYVYYDDGLGGFALRGLSMEASILRFVSYEPFFYGDRVHKSFSLSETISSVNGIIQQTPDGNWVALSTGINGIARAIIRAKNGMLIVGGDFTSAGGVTAYRIAMWDGSSWFPMGDGFNDDVYQLIQRTNGNIIAVGQFTLDGLGVDTYRRIAEWNWTTLAWAEIGGGANDDVRDIVIDSADNLYICGHFTSVNNDAPITASRVAKWNGSSWSVLGPVLLEGLDNDARGMCIGLDGKIIVGGGFSPTTNFTIAGGVSVNNVAIYDPATNEWSAMGEGVNSANQSMVTGSDGRIYTTARPETAVAEGYFGPAVWNGVKWEKLGSGSGIQSTFLSVSSDGVVYSQVDPDYITVAPDYVGFFEGYQWLGLQINLPGLTGAESALLEDDGTLTLSFFTAGDVGVPGQGSIVNDGSAPVQPKITMTGTGRIYRLTNYTTGDFIYFNLLVQDGESITLDLKERLLFSSVRGTIVGGIVAGSNLATWRLVPGANKISLLSDDSNAVIDLYWRETYWSFDG